MHIQDFEDCFTGIFIIAGAHLRKTSKLQTFEYYKIPRFVISECSFFRKQIYTFQNVQTAIFKFSKFQNINCQIVLFPILELSNFKFHVSEVSKSQIVKFQEMGTWTFHIFQNFRFSDMKTFSRMFPYFLIFVEVFW